MNGCGNIKMDLGEIGCKAVNWMKELRQVTGRVSANMTTITETIQKEISLPAEV
jgi:hypothetical protein